MRARGVVALSTLAVAMACGGRTNSLMPDEPAGTGGGGASGGSGKVPVAGSTSSAGTGPCLCIGVGCDAGLEWVPEPGVCCAGKCVLVCDDVACSDIDLGCRPGMHIGTLPDECCPLCVPDNPPSCDVAMKLYEEFRTQRLAKYQSAGCQDRGCAVFGENNRCASTCGAPIPSAFRDLIEEDLTLFAEQTCAACPKSFPIPCPATPPFACIDNSCQVQPIPPQ
jgi:hypothetical protein